MGFSSPKTSAKVGQRSSYSPSIIRPGSTTHSAAKLAKQQTMNINTLYGFTFYFFHNALLKSNNTVNISRRPISMTKVATHLAAAGRAA